MKSSMSLSSSFLSIEEISGRNLKRRETAVKKSVKALKSIFRKVNDKKKTIVKVR